MEGTYGEKDKGKKLLDSRLSSYQTRQGVKIIGKSLGKHHDLSLERGC